MGWANVVVSIPKSSFIFNFKSKLSVLFNKTLKLNLINCTITISIELLEQIIERIIVELYFIFIFTHLIVIIKKLV